MCQVVVLTVNIPLYAACEESDPQAQPLEKFAHESVKRHAMSASVVLEVAISL